MFLTTCLASTKIEVTISAIDECVNISIRESQADITVSLTLSQDQIVYLVAKIVSFFRGAPKELWGPIILDPAAQNAQNTQKELEKEAA